jgi:dienelactone hydrolase
MRSDQYIESNQDRTAPPTKPRTILDALVIRTDRVELDGNLALPDAARGVVLFAHGSGSSRKSPRNRAVADVLCQAGFGTVLLDLLTPAEEQEDARTAELRFDIGLLARRLIGAVDWLGGEPRTARLPIGLFGASTGAAGALVAAAERPGAVRAVVSRGGRPDLAVGVLNSVVAPTLLIVGALDHPVLELNRQAAAALAGPQRLHIVSGATHLFPEPGALEEVAEQAVTWFGQHLAGAAG